MNISYVYDKGQFVAVARNLGGRSVGVTVPDQVRREMGIRPGVKLVVKVRIAKESDQPEEDFRCREAGRRPGRTEGAA